MAVTNGEPIRAVYERRLADIRRGFEVAGDGLRAVTARSALLDEIISSLWANETAADRNVGSGIAVVAIGGYGRGQLFPHSDVDVLFCSVKSEAERAKDAIRRVSQSLWDAGVRVSLMTRTISECERFTPENAEFGLSLLDRRAITGDATVFAKLNEKIAGKLLVRDAKAIRAELLSLTRERHKKYGDTLFHLEPNVKDCPGGLRDAHVCGWLQKLQTSGHWRMEPEFADAMAFMTDVRCFLHYRHERDNNSLDWHAQDAAAQSNVGRGLRVSAANNVNAAAWMRTYFRHAREIDWYLQRTLESNGLALSIEKPNKRTRVSVSHGFQLKNGQFIFDANAEADPDIVLTAFIAVAKSGIKLSPESEERVADALPLLSANLEEGPALWRKLSAILMGERAGVALRSMHAIGVLELILPEFHGIDALVIRDAYHRYTVDEHTFVLIDTLHGLEAETDATAPEWRIKLGAMIRELQNPGLLYLAALLHDTGKGRVSDDHAVESSRIAEGVLKRLVMDDYDSELVLRLIENHLEMSVALRRDIFDAETVHTFAAKVQTHETLRMLTLFTFADINAVHPDALTSWKAENLWRLSMSAANQLDRNVDEERVRAQSSDEDVASVLALLRGREREARQFLDGFPERYLRTRAYDTVVQHFELSRHLDQEALQIVFHRGSSLNEITLVSQDRPRLFSSMAGALAAWGMNVVTADAFANAAGVVVDSFRFTDEFKTLELNASERERFITSVRDLVDGKASIEKMLSGRRIRRRAPRVQVETRIEFDETASTHSTLLQVVTQDVPGLLRALSETLSRLRYNVEVALIDTEGETAIDVFYLTRDGNKLDKGQQEELRNTLLEAISENAK